MVNTHGYRYLQDYGLGPPDPWPRKKTMELGPRDRLSQAFWHEEQSHCRDSPGGSCIPIFAVWARKKKLHERLPQICEMAEEFVGVDPVHAPIPVRPALHYTMGGILADIRTGSPFPGLYSAGDHSSVGIHGANLPGLELAGALPAGRRA
jgi:fumarate reductase flavoprotein subunit